MRAYEDDCYFRRHDEMQRLGLGSGSGEVVVKKDRLEEGALGQVIYKVRSGSVRGRKGGGEGDDVM